MIGFQNDVGEAMAPSTDGLTIVCPQALYFAALEAVNATFISNMSNVLAGLATPVALSLLCGRVVPSFNALVGRPARRRTMERPDVAMEIGRD